MPAQEQRGWARGMGRSIIDHDLALAGSPSILRQASSVAYNFGFSTHMLPGESTRSVAWLNKIRSGPGAGQYLFQHEAKGAKPIFQAFKTIDEGIAWKGSQILSGGGELGKNFGGAASKFSYRAGFGGSIGGASGSASLGMYLTAGIALLDARRALQEGEGLGGAAGAAGKSVLSSILFSKAIGMLATNALTGGLAVAGVAAAAGIGSVLKNKERGNRYLRQTRMHEFGGHVSASMHTQQAFTMRQRAMVSMQHSHFNAMRALGNEASFIHMPKAQYGNSTHSAQPMPVMGY